MKARLWKCSSLGTMLDEAGTFMNFELMHPIDVKNNKGLSSQSCIWTLVSIVSQPKLKAQGTQ